MSVTASLVIDVQTGLATGAYREKELLEVINLTNTRVRCGGGMVVFVQHCHASYEALMVGNPGWQLHSGLDVKEQDLTVAKRASDSFYDTELEILLRDAGVENVIISGLQSEFCVDSTCRAALSRGFAVTLLSDGHTTGDSHMKAVEVVNHHNIILANLASPDHPIRVVSSQEVIEEVIHAD